MYFDTVSLFACAVAYRVQKHDKMTREIILRKGTERPVNCHECFAVLEEKPHIHVESVYGTVVIDEIGTAMTCTKCQVVFLRGTKEYQLRAAIAVLMREPFLDGCVVRYAREAMGANKQKFAEMLRTDIKTVNSWEQNCKNFTRLDATKLIVILHRDLELNFDVSDRPMKVVQLKDHGKHRLIVHNLQPGDRPWPKKPSPSP